MTPIAIVTTPTTEKKGVVSPRLLPDWAILDPELTLGLPAQVTAATGIDAMVHAIEAYTSKHRKNPMSDQLARQALTLLSANVRKVCADGSISRRARRCCWGRCWPAWHSPIHRSRGSCAGLPDRRDIPCAAWIVERPGPDAGAALQFAGGGRALCRTGADRRPQIAGNERQPAGAALRRCDRGDLPGLQRAGIARRCGHCESDLKKLAEDAMKQTRLLVNNPREVSFDDALAIYTEAFGNRAAA